MAKRIQRSRAKGWRIPAGAVFVGRQTIWGNPFKPGMASGVFLNGTGLRGEDEILIPALTLEQCLEFYREVLRGHLRPEMAPHGHEWHANFKSKVHGCVSASEWARLDLRGHDLCCWCPLDQKCHADILLEVANG